MAAHFLEQDGQFDPAVAKPSDRFRETQGRPVQAGQGFPESVGRVGPLGDASGERGRCLALQDLSGDPLQFPLVVGQFEVHVLIPGEGPARARPRCCAGSRWCRR